jgi:hypothetical protein
MANNGAMEEGRKAGRKEEKLSERACGADGSMNREESKRASGRREGRRRAGKIRRGGGEARKQQRRTVKEGTKQSPGQQCLKCLLLIAHGEGEREQQQETVPRQAVYGASKAGWRKQGRMAQARQDGM